jgi:hypothetical protein
MITRKALKVSSERDLEPDQNPGQLRSKYRKNIPDP